MKVSFKGVRIWQKLLISSLLYAFPMGILLYFVVFGIQSGIKSTELELQGNKFLKPLEQLLQLIPQHRLLSTAYLKGGKELKDEMNAAAARIDETFGVLKAEAEALEKPLSIDAETLRSVNLDQLLPANIMENWSKLRKDLDGLIPEMCDLEHVTLLANIRGLISRIGDTSNLILDPELPSFYLVDITVLTIPQTFDQIGELMICGRQIISEKKPNPQMLSKVALLSSMLDKVSLHRMHQALGTAIKGEKELRGDRATLEQNTAKIWAKWYDSARFFIQSALTASSGKAGASVEEFTKIGSISMTNLGAFRDETANQLDMLLHDRIQRYEYKMYAVLLMVFAALAIAVFLVFLVSRGITGPLGKVMDITEEIASGNIEGARTRASMLGIEGPEERDADSEAVHYKDEIWLLAAVFLHMTHALNSLILKVQKSGIQVITSSTEISASSRQLEATAAQQAASTNEVSATAREISLSCNRLLESVKEVSAVASETVSLAEEGHSRLGEMKSTMANLMGATSSIASQLEAISQTTGSIGSVVTTMTKVADQTNLLSLNAAIEAEKAGGYGLGFSVVAREIHRLADQVALATLNIEQMVKKMEATVSAGVKEVDGFVRQVRGSVREVERISAELVGAIINHLHALIPRFEDIKGAMNVQSTGAEEISRAMMQLSEGAEQTRQVIVDFGNVTENLINAARELQNEVSHFKVN